MSSTFTSIETARRALATTQMSIQTTGNNISNANTDGYSRQRVNLETTLPYPSVGFNRPQIPGQIGTGVDASTIQRIRDSFVDNQVRQQTTSSGYWSAKNDALSQMEDIMNEPTDQSLSTVMDQFWQSLQDLASNPDDSGARSVVRQRGIAVADTFNYLSSSLTQVKDNLKTKIGVNVDKVNSLTSQINEINKQISQIEPNGYSSNDLYDKRDHLVDELTQYVNVKVTTNPSGGNSPATAVGTYTIQLIDPDTKKAFTLVDGKNLSTNQLKVDFSSDTPALTVNGQPLSSTGGSIKGQMESYSGDYKQMLDTLDQMAYNLSTQFNDMHNDGYGLAENGGDSPTGHDFFNIVKPGDVKNALLNGDIVTGDASGAASKIAISQDIMDSINNIATASAPNVTGDNSKVQDLANLLQNGTMTFSTPDGGTNTTTLKGYLESAIGQMGVNAQAANRNMTNSQTLQNTAEQRRQSISGVSMDEEMTNLIQYQQSYSAAARMVTTINSMLDTLIRLGQ